MNERLLSPSATRPTVRLSHHTCETDWKSRRTRPLEQVRDEAGETTREHQSLRRRQNQCHSAPRHPPRNHRSFNVSCLVSVTYGINMTNMLFSSVLLAHNLWYHSRAAATCSKKRCCCWWAWWQCRATLNFGTGVSLSVVVVSLRCNCFGVHVQLANVFSWSMCKMCSLWCGNLFDHVR